MCWILQRKRKEEEISLINQKKGFRRMQTLKQLNKIWRKLKLNEIQNKSSINEFVSFFVGTFHFLKE